jgi:hypothetical protein
MLVDDDGTINLMLYSVFKKLVREDGDIVKTNLMLNGVGGGGNPMEARDIISMELTVGSKSLATAFFVTELQGNCSVIFCHNWIHTNRCVPSTLHQFLIQWIDDEIDVVHTNASAYIALVNATAHW